MYQNYIFDLYGTLVDIRTNEDSPYLWRKMSDIYSALGAGYSARELKLEYKRLVREAVEQAARKLTEGDAWQSVYGEGDPETAKAIRDSRAPEHEDSCSMCGKFCAVRSMNKALNGEYIDIL